jgi:hypothetical protein
MISGVRRQVSAGVAGQGTATTAAPLIEDDRPEAGGIKFRRLPGEAGAPGPPCSQTAGTPPGEPTTSQYTA